MRRLEGLLGIAVTAAGSSRTDCAQSSDGRALVRDAVDVDVSRRLPADHRGSDARRWIDPRAGSRNGSANLCSMNALSMREPGRGIRAETRRVLIVGAGGDHGHLARGQRARRTEFSTADGARSRIRSCERVDTRPEQTRPVTVPDVGGAPTRRRRSAERPRPSAGGAVSSRRAEPPVRPWRDRMGQSPAARRTG